jgi:hypothetical protein
MSQDSEIVWAIIEAIAQLVLIHNDIETPMQAVFDAPMRADNLVEALGGERRAEEIVGGLGFGLALDFPGADNFADRRQPWPFILNPAVGIACSPESLAFYWHVRRDQCLPGSPGG